jgi:general secretion pathway protein D
MRTSVMIHRHHICYFEPALERLATHDFGLSQLLRSITILCATAYLAGCATDGNVKKTDRAVVEGPSSGSLLTPKRAVSSPLLGNSVEPQRPSSEAEQNTKHTGTGQFLRQTPASPPPAVRGDDAPLSLSFESGDIREITRNILGDLLGENFIIDPQVQGTVTMRTVKPIRKSDAFALLESLLKSNGFTLVRDGKYWRVTPQANAVRGLASPENVTSWYSGPKRGNAVVIYQVAHVGARELMRLLEPFAKDPASSMRVDEVRNWIFFAGPGPEIERLVEIADMFDVSLLEGMSFGVFNLKNSEVKAVYADWERVFGAGQSNPLAGLVRVVPLERLNALLIISPRPEMLREAERWVARLDQPGDVAGGQRLYVYYLEYTQAEKLQPVLSQALSSRSATPVPGATVAPGQQPSSIATAPISPLGNQPLVQPGNTVGATANSSPSAVANRSNIAGSAPQSPNAATGSSIARNATLVADKDRNALLIVATQAEYSAIESVIRKLDVPPKQVAIEVQIAEVTLTGDFQFGLQSFFEGKLTSPQNRLTSADGVGSIAKGIFTYTWSKTDTIKAVLNLSEEKKQIRTLAQPTLITLENQKASFNAGTQISVRTQTQAPTGTTGGAIDSFQYINTGINLNVTPRVSGKNVFLEIQQEISDAGVAAEGNPNPPITKRAASTTVMVQSGDTMLMGGLFQDSGRNASSGLPLVSSIPILGSIFGSQRWQSDRTELVLLITPRVLNDASEARDVVDELRKKMSSIESFGGPASTKKTPTSKPSESIQ